MSPDPLTLAGVGLFGKLPCLGDFVVRGLAPLEAHAWDEQLSRRLAAERDALGPDFPHRHDHAPPWRFWSGPDGLAPGWRAGALSPSVDSVGRRFFIVLCAHSLSPDDFLAASALAGALEAILYEALAGGWSADRIVTVAAAERGRALAEGREPSRAPRGWWRADGPMEALDDGGWPPRLLDFDAAANAPLQEASL